MVIMVTLVFGPEHGRTFTWEGPLPDPMVVPSEVVPMFQRYEFGEPFGPPITSMLVRKHTYIQVDTYDQGVEEAAIYFHHENCCSDTFEQSAAYKEASPQPKSVARSNRPRLLHPNDGFEDVGLFVAEIGNIINFGNPARKPEEEPK